jgi:hypothetical protein
MSSNIEIYYYFLLNNLIFKIIVVLGCVVTFTKVLTIYHS